jgi:CSLREA domain-containing protein
LTAASTPKTIATELRSRAAIRAGAVAVVAALIALVVPGAAAPQFGNLVVDTTADGNDGECNNDCTLREAIALADPAQGQWVSVRPGVYRLTQGPLVLQNDIVFGVSFAGNFSSGARTTVIDARGSGRVVDVPAGSTAVLAGLTITGGRADTGGGAFVANGGQLSIYDSIVRGNAATGRGGGVANFGNLSVFGSTFSGNTAGSGGAISSEPSTNTSIFNSTLSGNSATGVGGGIAVGGSTQISRATFANNTASSGGGMFVEGGEFPAATLMLNVLFAGNSSACGGATSQRTPWTANLSDDSTCTFAAGEGITTNPLLGPLANNGGPTDTHALGAGSPAINAGDPNSCLQGSQDQRHAPAPDACDIGAYEFGAVPPQADLPPPVAGETVNVSRARGTVKVKLPGSDEFFDLEGGQQVPVGSTFDTVKGRVNLQAAGSQRAWFYEGVFKLGQGKGRKPLSTLTLAGRLQCGGGGKASIAQKRKKRRLWGDGKGKFRTKGKHSAATVVGTRWLVEDRCNGTLTRVRKGVVRVRAGRKTIRLRAGQQYFARAK